VLRLGDPWTYRFFPFELGNFLLGALAWRYRDRLQSLFRGKFERHMAYGISVAIACVRLPVPAPRLLYPVAMGLVLPFLFRVTASSRSDRLVGEMSYPVYVFHIFVLTSVIRMDNPWTHHYTWLEAWSALLITLAISAGTVELEMRFLEPWRARLSGRPVVNSEN